MTTTNIDLTTTQRKKGRPLSFDREDALNKATSTFDAIAKAKSERLFKELGTIVSDIHTIAREAKIVSFNAQVIAARAGDHGREFAVVANVLSGITNAIAKQDGAIASLRVTRRQDECDVALEAEVRDLRHLANIMAGLRACPGVIRVDRARS
ncbi:MAG: hypothetical protein EBX37_18575 [Alphaproteobacteria bacterium]|nr:hypothetical protein [Alphaproteobacteria bacterium]